MSWDIWLIVGLLAAVVFILGVTVARANHHAHDGPLLNDPRVHSVVASVLGLLAVALIADTTYQQVRFTHYLSGEQDCYARIQARAIAITRQHAVVNARAVAFDAAMGDWWDARLTRQAQGPDDPAYVRFQTATEALVRARLDMIKVYDDNPPVRC